MIVLNIEQILQSSDRQTLLTSSNLDVNMIAVHNTVLYPSILHEYYICLCCVYPHCDLLRPIAN